MNQLISARHNLCITGNNYMESDFCKHEKSLSIPNQVHCDENFSE